MTESDVIDEWLEKEILTFRALAASGSPSGRLVVLPIVTPALETLRRHAPGTVFYDSAVSLLKGRADPEATLVDVADVLQSWQEYRRSGLAATPGVAVQARVAAATDLMEQVQRLLDDRAVHPAAPIVLAGAALEEALRSLVIGGHLEVNGKPGLQSYAEALKRDEQLTAQDVKDVTGWAGLRNDAAHGQFDAISAERAQIMVDGINLFMRQKLSATML